MFLLAQPLGHGQMPDPKLPRQAAQANNSNKLSDRDRLCDLWILRDINPQAVHTLGLRRPLLPVNFGANRKGGGCAWWSWLAGWVWRVAASRTGPPPPRRLHSSGGPICGRSQSRGGRRAHRIPRFPRAEVDLFPNHFNSPTQPSSTHNNALQLNRTSASTFDACHSLL